MPSDPIPFHQIAAFEAAARNLSFSRAARELNVQQPAVSRQVAMLEETLGVTLFVRTKPRLTLTPEGEILGKAVSGGFDSIQTGLRAVRSVQQGEVIVVNAAIGFTSLFLLPRLAEFQSLYPEVRLELVTRDQNPDFDPARCDIVVVFGESGIAGTTSSLIIREEMVPICKPGYLAGDAPLDRRALAGQRLLHMTSQEHADDWQRYFEGSGIAPPQPQPLDRIFSYMVYLRAIQNGNGIGLGWCRLIEDMIESRTLSLACDHKVTTERGYHCCIMPRAANRPTARAFLDWISDVP
ncbi:MAG: LysR substrate-binding domain-containing protein [Pseudomonadota bacterium]